MSSENRRGLLAEVAREIRLNQNAVDAFDEAACKRLGINRTDGRCLDIVDQDGPITAGHLAEATGLTTGAITTALDRLERAGYVRRVRDTADRRKVLVELTDEARRRGWEIWGPLAEVAESVFDGYTDEQLVLLRDFMRTGTAFLLAHAARVEALDPRQPG